MHMNICLKLTAYVYVFTAKGRNPYHVTGRRKKAKLLQATMSDACLQRLGGQGNCPQVAAVVVSVVGVWWQ